MDSVGLRRVSEFTSISPADYSVIVNPARTKQFSYGEVLYIESDPVDQIFLITSGLVKINTLGQNGSTVIVRLCASGDLVDVADLLSGDKHSRMATALRFCCALAWDGTTFKRLTERFPDSTVESASNFHRASCRTRRAIP